MRQVHTETITDVVARLCIEANRELPCDLESLIRSGNEREVSPVGQGVFEDLTQNLDAARTLGVPICQDTGMAVIFLEVGQAVSLVGEPLEDAVNAGVRKGYLDGLLRCSVVSDPLRRVNTGDNTPAVLHTRIVPGDKVQITVAPKGFGSENMSAMKMFTPSATETDVVDFVVDTIARAGSNPCPPIVVGVGIGGDFELCAYLAKKALCRDVSERHSDDFYAQLEQRMLEEINRLGIGPQGFGGTQTALAVNIETYPTHIAGLPVAVNVGCHVTRHRTMLI